MHIPTMNLVIIEGPNDGQILPVTHSPFVMGRGTDCDVLLHDSQASRRHAELRRSEHGWVLVDLGSTNGTFAGGQRLAAGVPYPLTAGVSFVIGHTTCELQAVLPPPTPAVLAAVPPAAALVPPAAAPVPPGDRTSRRVMLMAWLCRLIAAAGSILLFAGAQGDWVRVQVNLPLLGTVADRTFKGMESSYGWLMIEVAVLALVLVGIDIFLRRWARAAGLAEIIIALLGAGVLVVSAVMFNRVGGLQLFGVSLLDIFTQYLSNTIQVTIEPGLVLVAIGLGLLIVGGGLRLVVTHFER